MFGLDGSIRQGYVSVKLFGIMFILVWGWMGNMYYWRQRGILINIGRPSVSGRGIKVFSRNGLETEISFTIGPINRPFWNSEHIALWFGELRGEDEDYPVAPPYYEYRGWLGYHIYV